MTDIEKRLGGRRIDMSETTWPPKFTVTNGVAVFSICDAYEAGYGKGYDSSLDDNPYAAEMNEYYAWDIGYRAGVDARAEERIIQAKCSAP